MEARLIHAALFAATLLSVGANYRTQNFIVTAPTSHFAQQVAITAENYRRDLAVEWLGGELPPWPQPCPIRVDVGPSKGAGGATSFAFHGGRPRDWTMSIQGSSERILDSVLPHEITHTVFATHFGRPLPRWADEGACTTVEHETEKVKQHRMLYEFLTTGRGIAFNQMFAMTEYPPDVLPLYAQGYSLARFLIAQGGKRKFIEYVGDGMRWNNWTKATEAHYAIASLSDLQLSWLEWVRRGCPEIATSSDTLLASEPAAGAVQLASHMQDATERGQPGGSPEPLIPAAPVATGHVAAGHVSAGPVSAGPVSAGPVSAGVPAGIPAGILAAGPIPGKPDAAGTGWYARVRDQALAGGDARREGRASAGALHAAVGQAVSRGPVVTPSQVVTRPQPMERAEQRVLQW